MQPDGDMASTLTEELIEQILIRIPPEEPAHLVRAALVCKSWHGVLYDRGFRCRYREFHGTPPLFGYFQNHDLGDARFFPTTATASPVSTAALRTLDQTNWAALDCRHGRVLIYICDDPFAERERLIVWDPIAGRRQRLTVPPYLRPRHSLSCAGSVLCAANDCDHLSCSSGPYAVVFVWTWMKYAGGNMTTWASIYSSETGAWSAPASAHIHCYVDMSPGVFIGAALYFTITVNGGQRILKYDLHGHGLSVIETPPVTWTTLVMNGEEDGGLELVTLSDNCIYMWSSQQDVSHGIGGWVKHKVMELPALLPEHGSYTREVIGFVEGTDIVFITTYEGIFTLCLRSRQVRKVFERETYYMYPILPCMSFCIPR